MDNSDDGTCIVNDVATKWQAIPQMSHRLYPILAVWNTKAYNNEIKWTTKTTIKDFHFNDKETIIYNSHTTNNKKE